MTLEIVSPIMISARFQPNCASSGATNGPMAYVCKPITE